MNEQQYTCFEDIPPLMFITHRTDKYTELDEAKMAYEGGCKWVQLRMKNNLNLEVAREIVRCSGLDKICCIDDNLDIAISSGAFCVHLGKNDIPISEAWQIIIERGDDDLFHVGATANTFDDIVFADREGASYIGLGPFRFTETKSNLSPELGLEGYRTIMQQCKEAGLHIPIFAIGGIRLEDVEPLMETGITGIAVSGAIIHADDPIEETRRFIAELSKCTKNEY